MATTKTEYHVDFSCSAEAMTKVINDWLSANKFSKVDKGEGVNYYYFNDPWVKGKRSLEYYINGNQMVVYAYIGTYEKGSQLDGFAGSAGKVPYKKDLEPLFNALKATANSTSAGNVEAADMVNSTVNMNQAAAPSDATFDFEAQEAEKLDKMVVAAFIVSIVALVSCFCGLILGWLFIAFALIYAIKGLKSSRKGLATATIVITVITIILDFISLVIYNVNM